MYAYHSRARTSVLGKKHEIAVLSVEVADTRWARDRSTVDSA